MTLEQVVSTAIVGVAVAFTVWGRTDAGRERLEGVFGPMSAPPFWPTYPPRPARKPRRRRSSAATTRKSARSTAAASRRGGSRARK